MFVPLRLYNLSVTCSHAKIFKHLAPNFISGQPARCCSLEMTNNWFNRVSAINSTSVICVSLHGQAISYLFGIPMIVSIRLEYTLDLGLGVFPPRKIGNCWKRNGRETTPEWQWKIFLCKKDCNHSREHLALAHKLNENNEKHSRNF